METAVGLSWQEITENLSTVVDTKDGLVMLISIEEPNITVIYLINLPLIWIDLKKNQRRINDFCLLHLLITKIVTLM